MAFITAKEKADFNLSIAAQHQELTKDNVLALNKRLF